MYFIIINFFIFIKDDGDLCTVDECKEEVNGAGCTHRAMQCDDHNACTVDSCDTTKGKFYFIFLLFIYSYYLYKYYLGCIFDPIRCDGINTHKIKKVCYAFYWQNLYTDLCTYDTCNPESGCQHLKISCGNFKFNFLFQFPILIFLCRWSKFLHKVNIIIYLPVVLMYLLLF